MRQLAEGEHISPRQKTPNAGTLSSSSNVRVPGTDQITPVCLPLLSESKQLLWVYSNQIELPADSVAELDKAFDRFPYLTHKQSTALAQRCSLHPDQVKVWFIAQRIQYGISWDYNDICYVRNKFRSKNKDAEENREVQNKMNEEMQENKRKKNNEKDKEGESDEVKGGEEKCPKEGTTKAQMVSADENLDRKTKQERPEQNEQQRKAEEDNTNTRNKRKRGSKVDKGRNKRVKQDNNEGGTGVEMKTDKSLNREKKLYKKKQMKTVSEIPSEPDVPLSTSSPIQTLNTVYLTESQTDPQHRADTPSTVLVMTPVNISFEGKHEALAGLQEDLHTEASDSDIVVTDIGKLRELTSINDGLVPADNPPTPIKQDADGHAAPTRSRSKTQTQLAMLKVAFLHCQYPDSEQYSWLAELAEIPRPVLVQWYGDMRYALKRAKPRWMTEEQYKQTLSNVEYRQYKSKLKRSMEGPGNTALVKMLEMFKSSKQEENE